MGGTVDISELEKESVEIDELLVEAFGPESLGIIIVTGLPEKYQELRQRVLISASQLSRLIGEQLQKLESPETYWLVGWSKGKEKLKNGQPDEFKGSYYANCSFYNSNDAVKTSGDLIGYGASNLWPSKSDLPNFEDDLKELCCLIIDVAVIVARACDRYMKKQGLSTEEGYLERIVKTSTTTKARLLHYFANNDNNNNSNRKTDSTEWCSEHVDHSCLTGLTSAMFLDPNDNQVVCPDPDMGLFIKNRSGQAVKVDIPTNALAFQTGKALEIVTNGKFKAVPHYVNNKPSNICRNTLAVFCQPSLNEMVGTVDFATYARNIVKNNH